MSTLQGISKLWGECLTWKRKESRGYCERVQEDLNNDEFQWISMKTKCRLPAQLTHQPVGLQSPTGGWVSVAGGLLHSPTRQ